MAVRPLHPEQEPEGKPEDEGAGQEPKDAGAQGDGTPPVGHID